MADVSELDDRIAILRDNIRQLVEQAAHHDCGDHDKRKLQSQA